MPRGSQPGERRGGRKPGTPNKGTALVNAAINRAIQRLELFEAEERETTPPTANLFFRERNRLYVLIMGFAYLGRHVRFANRISGRLQEPLETIVMLGAGMAVVLLVENEEQVRVPAESYLEEQGHMVFSPQVLRKARWHCSKKRHTSIWFSIRKAVPGLTVLRRMAR